MENSKELNLTMYYALTLYSLKVAAFSAEMAKDFAHHPKIKQNLNLAINSSEARIRDLMHILRADSREDMYQDLGSDDLQALGAILHELIMSPGISPIEDEVIKFIKERKKEMHETTINHSG
ncbi:hypothetical protein Pan5_53 [Pseudanabaena phage Pan5]|nr:hypothetical protein Pan5_53 [Pseudanabaena phage Pan5]